MGRELHLVTQLIRDPLPTSPEDYRNAALLRRSYFGPHPLLTASRFLPKARLQQFPMLQHVGLGSTHYVDEYLGLEMDQVRSLLAEWEQLVAQAQVEQHLPTKRHRLFTDPEWADEQLQRERLANMGEILDVLLEAVSRRLALVIFL